MKKIIGYIISIIGLAAIASYTVPEIKSNIPLISALTDTTLLIAGLIIIAVGVFIVIKSGGGGRQKLTEVPIYQGKDVVGYRRHKK